jgi:ABC-type polysaccharide/polyol phosphate transport system ATPase subunit
MDFVKEVSTRSIYINKGKIIKEGNVDEVVDKFIEDETNE